ncbi:MAG: hypothetical protein N4A35_17040 [Flavobacteriales bacterium]|jgi:hypothetical protein|nr:hypothetical protein [Flavobacteriales bacterium]
MKNFLKLLTILVLFSSCAESITLFDAKISSKVINGTNQFGLKNVQNTSLLIKDPIIPIKEYSFLGRLIGYNKLRKHEDFIDLIFLKGDYGVLDEVYISYLEEATIPNYIPDNVLISADLWGDFLSDFNMEDSYVGKKQVMFIPKYIAIRSMLQKSIYTKTNPNDIKQQHKIEKLFKSGIKSNIKSVLNTSGAKISGEVEAKIENLINNEVNIVGTYYDIEFQNHFTGKLRIMLRELKMNPPKQDTKNPFLINYLDFYTKNNDYITNGYSLLNFEITYNTSKITKSDIKLIIDGLVGVDELEKNSLTAKVYSSFNYSRDFKGENKSNKMYLVKYGYKMSLQNPR